MRKLLLAGLTTAAAAGTLLAGSGPATAAPVSASTTPAGSFGTNAYVYHDWYFTFSNCESAGAALQVRGNIRNYYCQFSPYLTYYLYVDRV
ncbi:hypothetical protein [Kribbella sp. CA-293567]|uniref:hypothetical protein n=1 Tax=Kribbella sp. CA-293567 TaxID=3002436 RepID=UPI0022DE859D|nr:hypothetical protein [Kribbella sp. CA-293567]WBQ08415.1 hypothetical protein OX958_16740 [Kribbella sp. CA-293567]